MDAARELLDRKDIIENQLRTLEASLHKQGVGLNDPLIDAEGFPRADIDVSAVRVIRVEILKLRNDLKQLMADMEQCLYEVHSKAQATAVQPPPKSETPESILLPFAVINSVARNSPAERAGLVKNDRLLRFGGIDHTNHENLQALPGQVYQSLNQPLALRIQRTSTTTSPAETTIELELVPGPWEGNGFLG
ncbi:hypothetical protein BJ085DRAFT_16515 [Dimargaris cristalligena]|uniref:Probable 26S proteasome regulatory subunit p27 n=1 Tax=Dimargaris cristalligena TaxID=215637 RepID=A0A4P9ZUE7_9FUNG|nr:hypothetical protein BJ085DRAFT_16515 [Dimargaris cristalligena]|eukprot:RKP36868.1 hypothetical protein BJ085DRAFT_16515 [Dimargaris cristalligena]